jgi:hypothetical protein
MSRQIGLTAAIGIAAGFALVSLSPVQADSGLNGVYNITGSSGKTGRWTISSNCATEGCIAHVNSSSGLTGDAVLSNGRWTLTVTRPNAVDCPDGSTAPGTSIYSWDAATLVGNYDTQHGATCGDGPGVYHETFTLSKIS